MRENEIIIEIMDKKIKEINRMLIKMRDIVIKIVGENNGSVEKGIEKEEK